MDTKSGDFAPPGIIIFVKINEMKLLMLKKAYNK